MQLDALNEENINNLTRLWKIMGTQTQPSTSNNSLHVSENWPNRCWFNWGVDSNTIMAKHNIFSDLEPRIIVPAWDEKTIPVFKKILTDAGFKISFQQTAMYLNLEKYDVSQKRSLHVSTINSERDIENWTNIAAQSFEYEIDVSVIRKVANDTSVQLLLAYVDDQPAATAMLYTTDNIIGVHQFGVIKKYQGKGIARTLMQHVIKLCKKQAANYITLQASDAGEYLYRSLGFKQQFMIKNYQRAIDK